MKTSIILAILSIILVGIAIIKPSEAQSILAMMIICTAFIVKAIEDNGKD